MKYTLIGLCTYAHTETLILWVTESHTQMPNRTYTHKRTTNKTKKDIKKEAISITGPNTALLLSFQVIISEKTITAWREFSD